MQTAPVRSEVTRSVSRTSRLPDRIQRHLLASFLVLAYAVSWLVWLPLVVTGDAEPAGVGFVLLLLGSLAPSSVAIALVALLHGQAGVRKLLSRLVIWRVGPGWWAAIVLVPCLSLVALGLSILVGGESPDVTVSIPGAVALFVFSIFPGSAGGEEIGWRGLALPRLQGVRSALRSSVVLGVAWGVWHLPLYLTGADIRPFSLFAPWVVLTVASSILLTWIYNGTGGSLLLVILFHAASNVPLTVFLEPLDQLAQPFLIYVALLILAATVVVAAAGPATLSRSRATQVDVP